MTTHPQAYAVYTGRSTNWPVLVLMCVLLVPLLALAAQSEGWSAAEQIVFPVLIVAPTAVVVLIASSLRATAGPRGVTVHLGVLGWPRFRYPLERIARAEVVDVPASHWTWGVHWWPGRGTMLTLRGGEALRLTLVNGRRVTISTPDPAAAAAILTEAGRAA
ncbi:MAG: hypothetical protein AB7V62_14230 [Thermoleophilia bacterium]